MIITLPPPSRGHLHFFGSQVSQKRKGKGGVACVFLCDHPALFSPPPLKPISLKGEEERERLHWGGGGAGTLFFVLLFFTRGRILLNFIDLFAGNPTASVQKIYYVDFGRAVFIQLYIRMFLSENTFSNLHRQRRIYISRGKKRECWEERIETTFFLLQAAEKGNVSP